ncbi:MAG: hypothetical protein FWH03_03300 [Firmicutes bacterium]|nr:hypothetical protein [Bacillota bacterium]
MENKSFIKKNRKSLLFALIIIAVFCAIAFGVFGSHVLQASANQLDESINHELRSRKLLYDKISHNT